MKNYEKAFRDADKALEHYKRADADLELSRAEVLCLLWNVNSLEIDETARHFDLSYLNQI